jgi:hypothetical protein
MKKLLSIILIIFIAPAAFAFDGARIKVNVKGPIHNNRYFLCIPDVGCLSMLASKRGKVFPAPYNGEMNTIFVTDISNRRIYNQGLPASCNVKFVKSKTVYIHGVLVQQVKRVNVNHLHCTVM